MGSDHSFWSGKKKPMGYLEAIHKEIIILGCGNILFGDDGFGSSIAERLERCGLLPENVSVIDAGTSVREILFDLILTEQRPRKIIVIDAVDVRRRPGEIFTLGIEELPKNKSDDYTLHEMPTSNLLRELKDLCGVEVIIVAGQVESIPEAVRPGLSDGLARSVPLAVEEVLRLCGGGVNRYS